jgi:hypothetical protein
MTSQPAAPSKSIFTPEARLSYPALFEARAMEEGQKKKFSAVLLFKKDADLSELKEMVRQAGIKKWGPDQAKWPRPFRSPFRLQDDKAKEGVLPEGYTAGATFITVSTEQPPGVCGPDLSAIRQPNEIFAGCWVRCSVNAYCYGGPGTRFTAGIAIGLRNVQLLRRDKPLGGSRIAPELEFSPVTEEEGTSADKLI